MFLKRPQENMSETMERYWIHYLESEPTKTATFPYSVNAQGTMD